MRIRQNAVLAALLAVQRFLIEYATRLMSVVDLSTASKRLDEVIASFTTHAVSQDANKRSAKSETEKQHQLRVKLRTQQMKPISEIARRDLRSVPEFAALQMPPRSAKGEAFVASATAMANAAAIQKDALFARGLPADFLDQFQTLLTTFKASVRDRSQNLNERKGATKGLAAKEQDGQSVLNVLDALVSRALAGDDALLAVWEGARTIHRHRASATSTVTAPTPAPAGQSTAATTPTSSTPAAPVGTAA